MVITPNSRATHAASDAMAAWAALLHREHITAGELLDLLETVNRQNPLAPIPPEQAREAFKVFWQAQLDNIEAR